MNYPILYQWKEEISKHLVGLNTWQQDNIGLFSIGVVKASSSQQQKVARQVICGERVDSAARRMRRFIANKSFPVETFFEEFSAWVIGALPMERVYLLVDETKLGDRLATMVVGVAWEKRCIPLAWRCYKANSAADYPPEGQVKMIEQLLKHIKRGLPADKEVVVLADRGIGTSPDLCRAVEALGWKYLFRVTRQSKICTETGDFTIADMVREGEIWAASGKIFKKRGRIPAHARAIWSDGYEDLWALVTNDESLTGFEYGRRNWQEQSFRDLKSQGWQWEQSGTYLPGHMDRLMVLLVVAYAWTLALGSLAIDQNLSRPLQRHPDGQVRAHWSHFMEGIQFFFDVVQRYGHFSGLTFITDARFT